MGNLKALDLMCVIVKNGLGSKIIKCAKQNKITGGTIILGKGTIQRPLLKLLELNEVKREIILMACESSKVNTALEALNKKFQFYKPNHGIAFSISLEDVLGAKSIKRDEIRVGGEQESMYNLILVVVDKGNGELVVDAANKAGSKGATIINARGSGIHETSKIFSMEIEPEKELVLIVSEKELADGIASSIRSDLKIDEPGNGIIFIQDINKAYGLL
ncbi:P-II family nitrogen regulator [Proteinivorax hydrogeniformans]|uniref:P-II family nitrogen regulator n=1 Tax=Proteinivorax hydrogeniformans TaxID=1826727 RepID=A0AAU8HVN9_9FIRM